VADIRTVLSGGMVFDGMGAVPAQADVVVAGGRIVEVGRGLDGDEVVDCRGCGVLPGLFDCHVHLTLSGLDALDRLTAPFSLQFYQAAVNMGRALGAGVAARRPHLGLYIRWMQETLTVSLRYSALIGS
jgi:imidazolonepropionase-like amidohydrolase